MIINNATDVLKNYITITENGLWKVGNRYMKNPYEDKGELYILDSSWLESLYWNRDARTCVVYFQQFATNGKEPVVLFNVDGRIIRRFREALSPGRFYLKQFSVRGYGNHLSMSLEVFESAVNILQDYLPEIYPLFLINSKVIKKVFQNPGLAAARYVGNIVRNTFRALGFPVIQREATLIITNLQNIDDVITDLRALINTDLFFIDPKLFLENLKYNRDQLTANIKQQKLILKRQVFFNGFKKLFLPISLASFVLGLPISISNEVKKNLEILGVEEARQKIVNTKNISFLRRTTELKTKLLIGSSFSNPARKLQSVAIKPLQRYKTKLPKLSTPNPLITKLNETKKQIYKENKTLVKIKSINESKQRNTKKVTKLKSYKTY